MKWLLSRMFKSEEAIVIRLALSVLVVVGCATVSYSGAAGAADGTRSIAQGNHPFVSRGDGSGTHVRERQLLRRTGLPLETDTVTSFVEGQKKSFDSARPPGGWYVSVWQGMGKTIMVATENRHPLWPIVARTTRLR